MEEIYEIRFTGKLSSSLDLKLGPAFLFEPGKEVFWQDCIAVSGIVTIFGYVGHFGGYIVLEDLMDLSTYISGKSQNDMTNLHITIWPDLDDTLFYPDTEPELPKCINNGRPISWIEVQYVNQYDIFLAGLLSTVSDPDRSAAQMEFRFALDTEILKTTLYDYKTILDILVKR